MSGIVFDDEACLLTQEQLNLFSIPSGRGNTLLDYDLHPRFIHDRAQKKVLLSDEPEPRIISLNANEHYEIIPATIKSKNKEGVLQSYAIYPGTRESLIEDCLIYFARNGEFTAEKGEPGYVYENGRIGVFFTLYQLRLALKELGKEYKSSELREGLEILTLAKYRYTNTKDRDYLRGYIIQELDSIPNPKVNDKLRSDRIFFAAFDSRASKRILSGHYRSYDDCCAMSMKSPIARYLYKQFSGHWQNANMSNENGSIRSVNLNESTLASGCPLLSNATKRKENMVKALKELSDASIIQPIDLDVDVTNTKRGRKIIDSVFLVRPTSKFISQQIEGFKRLQKTKSIGDALNAKNKCLQNTISD